MADFRSMGKSIDVHRVFASEDGKHYRGYRQDLNPVIRKVTHLNQKVNGATKSENPNGWKFVGSIPMVVLMDWLKDNHYRMDQFARNEDRCKEKFMAHFTSREFAKLHNQHVTTRKESNMIVVPQTYGSKL